MSDYLLPCKVCGHLPTKTATFFGVSYICERCSIYTSVMGASNYEQAAMDWNKHNEIPAQDTSHDP